MHRAGDFSPRISGSRLTPSIAHCRWLGGRSTFKTSNIVGRKSDVIAVDHDSCAIVSCQKADSKPKQVMVYLTMCVADTHLVGSLDYSGPSDHSGHTMTTFPTTNSNDT